MQFRHEVEVSALYPKEAGQSSLLVTNEWREVPDYLASANSFLNWSVTENELGTAAGYLLVLGFSMVANWFGTLASAAVLAYVGGLRDAQRWSTAPEVLSLLRTIPSVGTQFAATIDMGKDSVDIGLVTFVDGWLTFEGVQTSFVIHRKECTVYQRKGNRLVLGVGTFGPLRIRVFESFENREQTEEFPRCSADWADFKGSRTGSGTRLIRSEFAEKPARRLRRIAIGVTLIAGGIAGIACGQGHPAAALVGGIGLALGVSLAVNRRARSVGES